MGFWNRFRKGYKTLDITFWNMIRKKREGGGGLIDLVLNSWGYYTSDLVLVKYNCPVPLSSNIFNEAGS